MHADALCGCWRFCATSFGCAANTLPARALAMKPKAPRAELTVAETTVAGTSASKNDFPRLRTRHFLEGVVMDKSRRKLLFASAGGSALAAVLAACGGGGGGYSGTAPSPPPPPPPPGTLSCGATAISANHGHTLTI